MAPASPLRQSYFHLVLTAEQVKLFYSGDKARVQVTDAAGKTLNIPWSALAPYVTRLGVRGNFKLLAGKVPVLEPADLYLNEHREYGLSTYSLHSDGHGVSISSRLRPLTVDVVEPGHHWAVERLRHRVVAPVFFN